MKSAEYIELREKLIKANSDASETIYKDFKNNDKFILDIANALYKDNNDDGARFIKVITDLQKYCIQTNRSVLLISMLLYNLIESNLDREDLEETKSTISIQKPNVITMKDVILFLFIIMSLTISTILLLKVWM